MPAEMPKGVTNLAVVDGLLSIADQLLSERRYVESVMATAEALELTLARCAAAVLMPAGMRQPPVSPAESRMLKKRYMAMIAALPLGSLRNLVSNLLTKDIRPRTVAEALQVIEQSKRFAEVPPLPEQVGSIPNAEARSTIEKLRHLRIIEVRNAVVHDAEQPSQRQARDQLEEVSELAASLVRLFEIGGQGARG